MNKNVAFTKGSGGILYAGKMSTLFDLVINWNPPPHSKRLPA